MCLEKYKQVINKDFIHDIDFINETIQKLNLKKSSTILDIGTGIGAMAILLAINEFDVLTGEPKFNPERDNGDHHEHQNGNHYESHHEEHFEGNWADWRESAKEIGVRHKIKYQHFNVEDLPFPDESYDGIFMYDSLQHIQNREQALSECLRVLAPNGVLCVIEWSKKTIELEKEKYGYEIEYLDPRDFLNNKDVSVEIYSGEFTNFYIIRKNYSN